ncbi:MAG: MaoC family dehydratase N-terminal domain-containing protein [Chloroflexi bacterium]|nr:MaoC family dehydratase N-terminal domain-containing protein [Chloroflexota bacterium]
MGSEESLISEEAKAAIGKETKRYLGEVSLQDLQRYAVTVGETNPLYFDEEYARKTPYKGIIAPPNMLSAIICWGAGPVEEELNPDGTEKREERFPLKVKRVMGGGQDLEFIRPVRPGDRLTVTTKLKDIYQREGRTGPLVFTVTENLFTNQRDEPVLRCTQTVILR